MKWIATKRAGTRQQASLQSAAHREKVLVGFSWLILLMKLSVNGRLY
jgi:hypothetical protein